jgi:prolyl-tRNA synthetase
MVVYSHFLSQIFMRTAIQPTRATDYPQWYQEVIIAADLAQVSPVRGCMIINPWGYAIWERIQRILDDEIKRKGHENIYCPLLIPLSHIEREAEHIDGFAKECAVVTHTKLKKGDNGELVPASALEEPLVIRPTSEMVIGDVFAQRIQSHRDLPLLMNQWANIMRWEMRTRMFLRTSEFLWQEGHTAHASEEEAHDHTREMLACYKDFCEDRLAIPIITGQKSKNEKFPGAVETYTIEGIMQDKKALQMGTSHYLGQTFAKSCEIQFQDADEQRQYVHTTSWGVTTRLIGGLIMTHADDDGLICPPRITPYHIVIIPIIRDEADRKQLLDYCKAIQEALEKVHYHHEKLRVMIDTKDRKPSEKKWHWVKKGVPIRCEIGMKEHHNDQVCYSLRVSPGHKKEYIAKEAFIDQVTTWLEKMHTDLFAQANKRLSPSECPIILTESALDQHFSKSNPSPALIYWSDDDTRENRLQEQYKVSIRCYPDPEIFDQPQQGQALFNPSASGRLALISKAY